MFSDVDTAVKSTVEQTIQTNRMFFFYKKCTGDLTSYNDLAQLTDPIGQIFHETLCANIRSSSQDETDGTSSIVLPCPGS